MFDWEKLQRELRAASKAAFTEIVATCEPGDVDAFGLYTDGGAMTACPAVNTKRHLATKIVKDDEPLFYKFTTAEWRHEGTDGSEAFDRICTTLRSEVLAKEDEDAPEEWFDRFLGRLCETCVAVLEQLRNEGFFRALVGEEVFVTFDISDDELQADPLRAFARRLNEGALLDSYLAWVDGWDTD